MATLAELIGIYVRAKDENRPHLLPRAFGATATLEIVANADLLSLPPLLSGLDAIEEMLSRFSATYENIYTFCLSSPPDDKCRQFTCDWLVGMSDKQNGAVIVGFGHYDWHLEKGRDGLIDTLKIDVQSMRTLDPTRTYAVMEWLSSIPYPWCPIEILMKKAPEFIEMPDR